MTAEADEKKQLKKMFCLLQKKRGSCIAMPNVVQFKTFWQVIKNSKHFGKEGNIANSCEK